jgi:serine acetyltransferase
VVIWDCGSKLTHYREMALRDSLGDVLYSLPQTRRSCRVEAKLARSASSSISRCVIVFHACAGQRLTHVTGQDNHCVFRKSSRQRRRLLHPGHLGSGLRGVVIAHGMTATVANRMWTVGLVVSGLVSVAIMSGLCGVRI